MVTEVGVSKMGQEHSSEEAGEKLVKSAREDGNIGNESFGLLFASSEFDLEGLAKGLESEINCDWMGGTTVAEISSEGFSEDTAVFMLIESDDIRFSAVESSIGLHEDAQEAAKEAGSKFEDEYDQELDNRLVLTLVPGFTQSSEGLEFKFLQGLEQVLDSEISVIGASTGDGFNLKENFQFFNGEVSSDKAVMALIQTNNEVVTGQAHGFEESIKTGVVTESEGRLMKKVGGKPAAEFYGDAIDVSVDELSKIYDLPLWNKLKSAFRYSLLKIRGKKPLMMHKVLNYSYDNIIGREVKSGEYRIISPLQVKNGGLLMTGQIREGQTVHVLEGDKEKIRNAGAEAFEGLSPGETLFGVVADCANRYLVLDEEEKDREVDAMREKIGDNLIGIYGEGEIGDGGFGLCTFVNQTVTGFAVKRE
ncbi:MAG: FIST signal transduction protein [Candidatus Nanohalobium sp.]